MTALSPLFQSLAFCAQHVLPLCGSGAVVLKEGEWCGLQTKQLFIVPLRLFLKTMTLTYLNFKY